MTSQFSATRPTSDKPVLSHANLSHANLSRQFRSSLTDTDTPCLAASTPTSRVAAHRCSTTHYSPHPTFLPPSAHIRLAAPTHHLSPPPDDPPLAPATRLRLADTQQPNPQPT